MGDWPGIGAGNRSSTEGENTATTRGATVTAGGSAHTKGSYTQLVASSPFDAQGFLLNVYNNTRAYYLLDVAVGAATSEQVILPNFFHSFDFYQPSAVYFPIPIPAGSRVAVRNQSSTGSAVQYAEVTLLSQGFLPGSSLGRVEAWGADTSDSAGATVDPGAVAHTKGAYTQLIASTAFDVRAIVIDIGATSIYRAGYYWLMDVALGAAASEQIILPDIMLAGTVAASLYGDILPKTIGPLPVHIPAGTRVAIRAQAFDTNATYRVFDAVIYGIG